MSDEQLCEVCMGAAIRTVATRVAPRAITCPCCQPALVCEQHALPGDLPLAGAVDAVREAAWGDLDEPRASAVGGGEEGA